MGKGRASGRQFRKCRTQAKILRLDRFAPGVAVGLLEDQHGAWGFRVSQAQRRGAAPPIRPVVVVQVQRHHKRQVNEGERQTARPGQQAGK